MRYQNAVLSFFIWLAISICAISSADEGFEESFSGLGDFGDTTGRVDGLEIPGWSFFSRSTVLDGTHTVSLDTMAGNTAVRSEEIGIRNFRWSGSFIQRLELRDVNMSTTENNLMGGATFNMLYDRPEARRRVLFGLRAVDTNDRLDVPYLGSFVSPASPIMCPNDDCGGYLNGVGKNIAMEIVYHEHLSLIEFRYDEDLDDDLPPIELSTFIFEPDDTELSSVILEFGASQDRAIVKIDVDFLSFRSLREGDFDYNQTLNIDDLAILADDLSTGELRRDLNQDNIVDSSDVDLWVHNLFNTYYGDANLDGEFNSADLVSVFHFAQYEDEIDGNSTWESGDWNLDGDFTTADLVLAFQDAGYEKGPRLAVQLVPEPTSPLTLLGVSLMLLRRRALDLKQRRNVLAACGSNKLP